MKYFLHFTNYCISLKSLAPDDQSSLNKCIFTLWKINEKMNENKEKITLQFNTKTQKKFYEFRKIFIKYYQFQIKIERFIKIYIILGHGDLITSEKSE